MRINFKSLSACFFCLLPVTIAAFLGTASGCANAIPPNADAGDSVSYYTHLLSDLPDDPAVYYNRGLCYFRLGKYSEAISDFSTALRLDHSYYIAYQPRADCQRLLGNYSLAISGYDSALSTTGGSVYIYNARAYCNFKMKNFNAAALDYSKVILQGKGDGETYLRRGISYYKSGDYKSAAIDLQRSVTLNPDSGLGYVWLGNAHYHLGRWDDAVNAYATAVEKKAPAGEETHKAEAYFERAKSEKEADPSQAIKDLNESIATDSANGQAYFLRAKLFYKLDDKESACGDFTKAGALGVLEAFPEAKKSCDPTTW